MTYRVRGCGCGPKRWSCSERRRSSSAGFIQLGAAEAPCWGPSVDLLRGGRPAHALRRSSGVAADELEVSLESGPSSVRGERAFQWRIRAPSFIGWKIPYGPVRAPHRAARRQYDSSIAPGARLPDARLAQTEVNDMNLESRQRESEARGRKSQRPRVAAVARRDVCLPEDALVILPVRGWCSSRHDHAHCARARRSIAAAQLAAKAKRPIGVCCSETPRSSSPDRMTCAWSGRRQYPALTSHHARRHAPCHLPGPTALPRRRVPRGLPLLVARVDESRSPRPPATK